LNYIREINAFYDWLETNSISDSAIALWHALMHINNKAGWITEFAVALSTLQMKTGLKKDAVLRARNSLQIAGRIKFKSRSGQQSAIYTITPFEGINNNCVVLNDTNCDTNRNTNREQTTTQTTTQTASINKLNSKQNETKKNKYTPEFEEWYSSWPRPDAKADSFKNFEKRRKEHGLVFILQCSSNFINYYNTLPPGTLAYQSNNFFGQKSYYLDYENARKGGSQHANPANLQRKNGSVPYPESERENPDHWGKSDEWVGPPIDDGTIDF